MKTQWIEFRMLFFWKQKNIIEKTDTENINVFFWEIDIESFNRTSNQLNVLYFYNPVQYSYLFTFSSSIIIEKKKK